MVSAKQDSSSGASYEYNDFSIYLQWMGITQWLPQGLANELTATDVSQTALLSEDFAGGQLFLLESFSSSQPAYATLPRVLLWAEFAPGAGQLSATELDLLGKMLAAINLKYSLLSASGSSAATEVGSAAVIIKLSPSTSHDLPSNLMPSSQMKPLIKSFCSHALFQLLEDKSLKKPAWEMLQQLQKFLSL